MITEGSRSDESNETFDGIEGSRVLPENRMSRLPRLVLLVPGS